MDQYLSIEEISQRLRISPETVRRWVRAGELPAVKIARQWRIAETEIKEYLAGHQAGGILGGYERGQGEAVSEVKADRSGGGSQD